MLDLSKFSTDDLLALKARNLSGMSTEGLMLLKSAYNIPEPEPEPAPAPVPRSKSRSWTEALITDPLASVGAGIGAVGQMPGQLSRLVSGEATPGPMEQAFKKFGQQSEEAKSTGLQAREEARGEKIAEAERNSGFVGQFATAFGQTISDPALLTSFLFEQVPQMVGAGGVGKLVQIGTRKALARSAIEGVASTAEKTALKAGVSASVATNAVAQGVDVGADTYDAALKELAQQGITGPDAHRQALEAGRAAAWKAGAVSLGMQALPGGRTVERAILGGKTAKGSFAGAVRGGIGETISEGGEEGLGRVSQNLALQQINPNIGLMEGVGTAAGLGAVGGFGMGVPAGFIGGRQSREQREREALGQDIPSDLADRVRKEQEIAALAEAKPAPSPLDNMAGPTPIDFDAPANKEQVEFMQELLAVNPQLDAVGLTNELERVAGVRGSIRLAEEALKRGPQVFGYTTTPEDTESKTDVDTSGLGTETPATGDALSVPQQAPEGGAASIADATGVGSAVGTTAGTNEGEESLAGALTEDLKPGERSAEENARVVLEQYRTGKYAMPGKAEIALRRAAKDLGIKIPKNTDRDGVAALIDAKLAESGAPQTGADQSQVGEDQTGENVENVTQGSTTTTKTDKKKAKGAAREVHKSLMKQSKTERDTERQEDILALGKAGNLFDTTKDKNFYDLLVTYMVDASREYYRKEGESAPTLVAEYAKKILAEQEVPQADIDAALARLELSDKMRTTAQDRKKRADAVGERLEKKVIKAITKKAAKKAAPKKNVADELRELEREIERENAPKPKLVVVAPTDVPFATFEDADKLLSTYLSDAKVQRKFVADADIALIKELMEAGKFDEAHGAVASAAIAAKTSKVAKSNVGVLDRMMKQQLKGSAKEQVNTVDAMLKQADKDVYELSHTPVGAVLPAEAVIALYNNDLKSALNAVAEKGSTPFLRTMAKRLSAALGNTQVTIDSFAVDGTPGMFVPSEDRVYIDPRALHEHTLLHESGHAVLHKILSNPNHPLTKELTKLYESFKEKVGGE
jgi:hypothetical protein